MDDCVRIKQILPITEGFTVLTLGEDENGRYCFHDLSREGWHYLFALVDGGKDRDDYVTAYELDAEGYGEIDGCTHRIVRKCACPKCGHDMTPRWDVTGASHLTCSCYCGYYFTPVQLNGGEAK